jgi:alcohol-forming fatty acyl-CoA reductase
VLNSYRAKFGTATKDKRTKNTSKTMAKNLHNFYDGATVLITGGTGFMGKVLVEKLVRCLNVETVVLLVRKKNDKTPEQRLVEYMQESVS